MQHSEDCLTTRYGELAFDNREYWPSAFHGREELCTCDARPDAAAKHAAFAEDVKELREYIKLHE